MAGQKGGLSSLVFLWVHVTSTLLPPLTCMGKFWRSFFSAIPTHVFTTGIKEILSKFALHNRPTEIGFSAQFARMMDLNGVSRPKSRLRRILQKCFEAKIKWNDRYSDISFKRREENRNISLLLSPFAIVKSICCSRFVSCFRMNSHSIQFTCYRLP